MVYYNEFDPGAAMWLRALIGGGLIPPGYVDERSISEVQPRDLQGFSQCHFFAGVGGWPLALDLAGWSRDRPVWTGSCPCQPFSSAGKQRGTDDERHLWPEFNRLIANCGPPTVFGEQVAGKAGRLWLAGVRADLETLDYAVGAADLCAAGVGAPHIRQRLFWVADSNRARQRISGRAGLHSTPETRAFSRLDGEKRGVADTYRNRRDQARRGVAETGSDGSVRNGWGDNWIACADGKARRIEPGLSPLAHGVPGRVVRLRGYGNAIVPQVAAEFIAAFMEIGL